MAKLLETKLLIDIGITIFGIYMLAISIRMKTSGKINPIFLAEEDLKRCKKKGEYAAYMSVRALIFSVLILICGIFGIVCDLTKLPAYLKYAELAVFLLAFFNFIRQTRNAKDLFVF